MKKTYRLTLIALLTMMFQVSFGQKELYGNWQVTCPFELADQTGVTVCSLCPVIKRQVGYTVQGFDMTVDKDEIKFNFNNEIKKAVKYKWDDTTKTIEFVYNEKTYQFRTLFSYAETERYILKNNDGLLLILDEKK